MDWFENIDILCPKCKKQNKLNTDNFNNLELQKCGKCGNEFTLYDIIDAYESWEKYIQTGFRIQSDFIIKDVKLSSKESDVGIIDEIEQKTNLKEIVNNLVYDTIKYGTSYLKTNFDNGKFNGFEILDPKETRIKVDYGKESPNQVTLGLVPIEYYNINGKWSYEPKDVHHFSMSAIPLSHNNIYGLPDIYLLFRDITYHQLSGNDYFLKNIKIGFYLPNFLIEKQDGLNIPLALHDIDSIKFKIEMIENNILNYLKSIFLGIYGKDTEISLKAEYFSTDDILNQTGYSSEISRYRSDIKETKTKTYKILLDSGIITKEEYEKMISKN